MFSEDEQAGQTVPLFLARRPRERLGSNVFVLGLPALSEAVSLIQYGLKRNRLFFFMGEQCDNFLVLFQLYKLMWERWTRHFERKGDEGVNVYAG